MPIWTTHIRDGFMVLSGFYCQFVSMGFPFSTGVLYPEIMAGFPGANRAFVASIFTVCVGLTFIGALLAGILITRLGARITLFIGAVLSCAGLMTSYFATGVEFLFATFGLLAGTGFGLLNVTSMVFIKDYFGESKRVALALVSLGSGAGSLIFQELQVVFIGTFGWRGCTLLLSGVLLQVFVPITFMILSSVKQTGTDSSKPKRAHMNIIKSVTFNIWLIYTLGISLAMPMTYLIIVDHEISKGFSLQESTIILMVISGTSNLGRFLCIGLMKLLKVSSLLYAFSTGLVLAACLLCFTYVDNYYGIVALSVTAGVGLGFWIVLLWVCTLDIVGEEKYVTGQSLVLIVYGVGAMLCGPFAGFVRDSTGAHDATFRISSAILGGVSVLSAICQIIRYLKTPHVQDTRL